MLRTEVTVGGCCWAVEPTIRRSLFYEVNAKILCFCGQRSHPQVFTGPSLQQLLHQLCQRHPCVWPLALHAACWRGLWRCCLAASSLRSRSAWISCCRPASTSFGVT